MNNAIAVTARHCFHHHAADEEEATSRSLVETVTMVETGVESRASFL